ncbi:MAG: hypothetical protein V4674_00710 [Patescibacteria group bacterium]
MTTDSRNKIAAGVGLGLLTLGAVGGYYLYAAEGATKRRRKLRAWIAETQEDLADGLEKANELTKSTYKGAREKAVEAYEGIQEFELKDLVVIAALAKGLWNKIRS